MEILGGHPYGPDPDAAVEVNSPSCNDLIELLDGRFVRYNVVDCGTSMVSGDYIFCFGVSEGGRNKLLWRNCTVWISLSSKFSI
jgi:hypothetical protein